MNPDNRMIAWIAHLLDRDNPKDTVAWIMQHYGIDRNAAYKIKNRVWDYNRNKNCKGDYNGA